MRFRLRAIIVGFAGTAVAAMTAGCSPGPLTTPHVGAPMSNPRPLSSEAGSGALETARRQLTGTWELVALESAPPGDPDRVPIEASGTLTYDEYGNLTIDAHTTDPSAPVAAREKNFLSFKGRAVLDLANSELKLMDMTGNVDPDEVLAPERRRRFAFGENTLTLSSFDERGQVTAISTWHKRE